MKTDKKMRQDHRKRALSTSFRTFFNNKIDEKTRQYRRNTALSTPSEEIPICLVSRGGGGNAYTSETHTVCDEVGAGSGEIYILDQFGPT